MSADKAFADTALRPDKLRELFIAHVARQWAGALANRADSHALSNHDSKTPNTMFPTDWKGWSAGCHSVLIAAVLRSVQELVSFCIVHEPCGGQKQLLHLSHSDIAKLVCKQVSVNIIITHVAVYRCKKKPQ